MPDPDNGRRGVKKLPPTCIKPGDACWPRLLAVRLGTSAPSQLSALGNLELLALPKTAPFCSARCPGDVILTAYDHAARWRDAGRCMIGGFHSPIEKECLRILLRGRQPIVICPARAMESMRIPIECRAAFDSGRILFLSQFVDLPVRVTKESAFPRNEMVAALADDVYVAHVSPGGQTEAVVKRLEQWEIPRI